MGNNPTSESGDTDDHLHPARRNNRTRRQILEVVLGVSQKVMSNYTNHLADTPVDAPFRKFAWQKTA